MQQISFGAGSPAGVAGDAAKAAAKKMPWIARALMYVGQNDGEILNTLVTAFGTAVIAPIFIAGNPISKEDKETKWYSAMRQPISAVIAMIMQIGVANVYNGFMGKMASLGKLGENMDLRAKPEGKYLKKIIKLEEPQLQGRELSEAVTARQIKAEKVELAKLRAEMRNQDINIDDLISKKVYAEAENEIRSELEATYTELMDGKKIKKRKLKKYVDSNVFEKNVKERARQNLRKEIVFETEVKHNLRKLINEFTGKENAIDLAIEKVKVNTQLDKEVIAKIIEKLEKARAYEVGNGKPAFSSIPKIGDSFADVMHNVKVKKLLKARTADAERFFKNFRNIGGLIVAMLTLPISCGLLNWAYPRVMEKVMPKLQPWIHRNDPDWSPETAKKYGPQPKAEKVVVKVVEEADDDED